MSTSSKTVLCHGVFDILHIGHIKYLEAAKKHGNRLVVSITADRFVDKGPGRPYFSAERRAEMLRAIKCVDEVWICDERTAIAAIRNFKPNVYVKGQDYKDASHDVTGEIENERKAVESYGGRVVFTNEEVHSSSSIVNSCLREWSEEQKETISKIMANGGFRACANALEKLSKLKVLVIGEPIIDIYRFVKPEGISSKSPSISCRFEKEEVYEGGSTAIFKHLNSFCDAKLGIFKEKKPAVKIRYIAGSQRVFEVTEIEDSQEQWQLPKDFDADVIVAADFGHGMFSGSEFDNFPGFVGLNVQTNSSNFGFNVYTKHKKFDYLCLDTREIRLGEHDRYSKPLEIAEKIRKKVNKPMSFTCGSDGAFLLGRSFNWHSPAFSDMVIDATGAGDAYFAITTLLMATECNEVLVPFIGNVFAGLKTKIIGNKSAVTKPQLIKAIKSILA